MPDAIIQQPVRSTQPQPIVMPKVRLMLRVIGPRAARSWREEFDFHVYAALKPYKGKFENLTDLRPSEAVSNLQTLPVDKKSILHLEKAINIAGQHDPNLAKELARKTYDTYKYKGDPDILDARFRIAEKWLGTEEANEIIRRAVAFIISIEEPSAFDRFLYKIKNRESAGYVYNRFMDLENLFSPPHDEASLTAPRNFHLDILIYTAELARVWFDQSAVERAVQLRRQNAEKVIQAQLALAQEISKLPKVVYHFVPAHYETVPARFEIESVRTEDGSAWVHRRVPEHKTYVPAHTERIFTYVEIRMRTLRASATRFHGIYIGGKREETNILPASKWPTDTG